MVHHGSKEMEMRMLFPTHAVKQFLRGVAKECTHQISIMRYSVKSTLFIYVLTLLHQVLGILAQ